jgi:hypothetical protein
MIYYHIFCFLILVIPLDFDVALTCILPLKGGEIDPKDKAIIALSFFVKKFNYINLDYLLV